MTLLNHPSWRVSPRSAALDAHAPLIVIVSDVDGTLLDRGGKLPVTPARLRGLLEDVGRAQGSRIVLALASSRTLAELLVLQRMLGVAGPCIAEDGGVLAVDEFLAGSHWSADRVAAGTRRLRRRRLGASHRELRDAVTAWEAPALRDLAQLDAQRLASLGFRSWAGRRRAIERREASVLFDLDSMTEFTQTLLKRSARESGATLHCGGRWHTLTRDAGKGGAVALMRTLVMDHVARESCGHGASARDAVDCSVIAVGNDENDASLLAAADQAFAIHNPTRGPHPALLAVPGAQALSEAGTAGFVEMLELLAQPVSVR